jgi:hypothetical protein
VNERRLRIDLYAFAHGALALLSLVFLSARNGAALIMCGLVFAGLVIARLADFSSRALVPVALGLVVILWMVWLDPPASSHKTSALAHFAGGALVGWAVSEYLRTRIAWPLWGAAALVAVVAVTVCWELGELVGDRVLDTALIPSARDSAEDIFFGTLGGGGAVLIAWLLAPARAGAASPRPSTRSGR